MVYVIQVCWHLANRIRTELHYRPDPVRKLYDIYHCCVYSEKTADDGQRNSPKYVEFYSKDKFEKQDQDGTTIPSWSCSQAVSKPVWHIPLPCVQYKTADDGQRNCPKHVEFYSKNKFEKLVPLVGFILRTYHDARSPEALRRSGMSRGLVVGDRIWTTLRSQSWTDWPLNMGPTGCLETLVSYTTLRCVVSQKRGCLTSYIATKTVFSDMTQWNLVDRGRGAGNTAATSLYPEDWRITIFPTSYLPILVHGVTAEMAGIHYR